MRETSIHELNCIEVDSLFRYPLKERYNYVTSNPPGPLRVLYYKFTNKLVNTYVKYQAIINLCIVVAYYEVGITFYSHYEGWRPIQCAYFISESVTTIGTGHFHPTSTDSKLFTIPYLFLGTTMVLSFASAFARTTLTETQDGIITLIHNRYYHSNLHKSLQNIPILHQNLSDNNNNNDNIPVINTTTLHRYRLYLSIATVFFLLLVGMLVYGGNEGWSYIDSFYWPVCIMTTVGYGDHVIKHDSTLIFGIIFIYCSVLTFSVALNNAISNYMYTVQRHETQKILKHLSQEKFQEKWFRRLLKSSTVQNNSNYPTSRMSYNMYEDDPTCRMTAEYSRYTPIYNIQNDGDDDIRKNNQKSQLDQYMNQNMIRKENNNQHIKINTQLYDKNKDIYTTTTSTNIIPSSSNKEVRNNVSVPKQADKTIVTDTSIISQHPSIILSEIQETPSNYIANNNEQHRYMDLLQDDSDTNERLSTHDTSRLDMRDGIHCIDDTNITLEIQKNIPPPMHYHQNNDIMNNNTNNTEKNSIHSLRNPITPLPLQKASYTDVHVDDSKLNTYNPIINNHMNNITPINTLPTTTTTTTTTSSIHVNNNNNNHTNNNSSLNTPRTPLYRDSSINNNNNTTNNNGGSSVYNYYIPYYIEGNCREERFILITLMELGILNYTQDIEPLRIKFKEMDRDRDKSVTYEDLLLFRKYIESISNAAKLNKNVRENNDEFIIFDRNQLTIFNPLLEKKDQLISTLQSNLSHIPVSFNKKKNIHETNMTTTAQADYEDDSNIHILSESGYSVANDNDKDKYYHQYQSTSLSGVPEQEVVGDIEDQSHRQNPIITTATTTYNRGNYVYNPITSLLHESTDNNNNNNNNDTNTTINTFTNIDNMNNYNHGVLINSNNDDDGANDD